MVFLTVFNKALNINRTLGTKVAAKYLFNRGVSIETARYLLLEKPTVKSKPHWAI